MLMLLTYDLDRMWYDVKKAALDAGFLATVVTTTGKVVGLPNTTLLVEAATPRDAIQRFVAVVRSVSPAIVIERAAAFDWDNGFTHTDRTNVDSIAALFETELFGSYGR